MKKNLLVLFAILLFSLTDCIIAQVPQQSSPLLTFNFYKKKFSNATVRLNDGA